MLLCIDVLTLASWYVCVGLLMVQVTWQLSLMAWNLLKRKYSSQTGCEFVALLIHLLNVCLSRLFVVNYG